ncbi:MAG: Gfo/Idh/MocA family oxidoreductase [Planctomycetota bacterium]|nr:Gfo/Idh/MocA family oxidoreductase [Planctomycetota bacterium]
MSHPETNKSGISLNRRGFLKVTGMLGAGLAIAPTVLSEEAKNASKTVNVAFIGVGTQGRVLLTNALKVPNLKFVAVTDVWPYHQGYAVRLLKKYQHNPTGYVDHMEMLEKEKELDAVIIATPDWKHAEHTIACLKAGKHVYCEKEMSNSLELAKQMVVTSKETKKLLQIGHQRRSNPRYHAAFDFVSKKKACGKMGFVSAQWNRAKRLDVGWPKDQELDAATLAKLGYESMQKFRNWRWYKKYSGGPIADLGSHQIDIFNWYLGASPRAVMASGGMDWSEGIEWYDNINAIYEWEIPADGGKKRIVRGFYQTLSFTSNGGYAETFVGDEGSLIISENAAIGGIRREQDAPEADWEKELAKQKAAAAPGAAPAAPAAPAAEAPKPAEKKDEGGIKVGHSVPQPGRYYPPIPAAPDAKSEHLPHIENFIAAVRDSVPLNCPGEVGYDTAVTVLKVNEAVATQKRMEYTPEEFKA